MRHQLCATICAVGARSPHIFFPSHRPPLPKPCAFLPQWVLMIDCDEFLVLNQPSIHAFVGGAERAAGRRLDAFLFRWTMIESLTPWCLEHTPFVRVLLNERPAANRHHKSMARVTAVSKALLHDFRLKPSDVAYRVWADAALIASTYHIGYTPYVNGAYSDSALVHVHTRSVSDLLKKAMRTSLKAKIVRNASALIGLVQRAPTTDRFALLDNFLKCIGLKASLPLAHTRYAIKGVTTSDIVRNISLFASFNPVASRGMCAGHLERESIRRVFATSSVSMEQYEKFAYAISLEYASALERVRDERVDTPPLPAHPALGARA